MSFPRWERTLAIALLSLLVIVAVAGRAYAAEPSGPPDTTTLTPAQARHTLSILQDNAKRAELEQTLNAIAQATAPTSPVAVPAEPAPKEADVGLTQGGLLDQLLEVTSRRLSRVADWVHTGSRSLANTRSAGQWWQESMGTTEQKITLLVSLLKVVVIIGIALVTEWLLKRTLKRARHMLSPERVIPAITELNESPPDAERYSSLLRRVPYALGLAVLRLLPLLGFLAVASVLASVLSEQSSMLHGATLIIIAAYAASRIALAILKLFVSPEHEGLRLMHMSNTTAALVYRWFSWIIVIAVFGMALANVLLTLGASMEVQQTIAKFVALLVHVLLLVLVWRSKTIAAAAIRGTASGNPGLFGIRRVLADVWPFLATVFIIGVWLLWSAGTPGGFERLIHLFARSAAVIVVAGLISIYILGVIDRTFSRNDNNIPGQEAVATAHPRNLYHQFVHRMVYIVIAIATGFVLLQVWGFAAWEWFREGSVGRHLASAAITISITCILAAVAWESLNITIHRRIDRWRDTGEFARAARLRTLVPMIRTALLVVIVMIVLLTALSQLGINIAPLLAGASIIGVALGFGSQKLVQDFITGIFLLMEDAMQVGDWVTVAGLSGSVEYLSIRTVRLRAGDGALHVVPFSAVSSVTNTNRGLGNASVRVSVAADSNIEDVFSALKSVGADMRIDPKLKDLILADLDIWGVDQVDGNMITIAGQIRTLDKGRWPVQREFNRRMLLCFRERDIRLVNPKETLLINTDQASGPSTAAQA